ncbi:hypothetical protein Hdeb2414_s0620g00925501 [Helianthus debilis subsp. tardiflorus]
MEALEYAKELLRLWSEGSKIYLGFGFICVDFGEIDAAVVDCVECYLEIEDI